MRRIAKISSMLPVLYLFIIPLYLDRSTGSTLCSKIEIHAGDSSEYQFVTEQELMDIAFGDPGRYFGRPVRDIDISEIEDRMSVISELKATEVFITIDGVIHINAEQRNPIMRVIPDRGGNYFIDEEGVILRKRNISSPRLHIIGGNINVNNDMLGINILDNVNNPLLADVFHLVKHIYDDNFWSAQIDQIFIDNDNEIDLIPRVGNHKIHLGTPDDYENKLKNLRALYDQVLPEVGWNKYSLINLEFKDQIVCKKR